MMQILGKYFVGALFAVSAPSGVQADGGKELFDAYCTSCHRERTVQYSSGYEADDWKALISGMIDMSDAPQDEKLLVDYLAKTYPPNTKRQSTLAPAAMELTFREWKTPTLGVRTRDPVEAPDGTIWWVGQWADILGSINPNTGEMAEYMLPAGAKPHSVSIGPNSNPWYMGNKNGTVGYLDLATKKIVEFKMPDPKARDPHTGVFDKNGTLWFTLQGSNMIGKLVPETGDIKLVDMPRPRSRPYGIKLDKNGDLYVACNGSNCLVKVDKDTMDLTLIELPHEDTHVRRLALTDDGMVWYVNSGRGRLGRYNPDNGEIKEWPTPSGEWSHPYAIEVADGAVWFNESRARPETLIRFDPETETMQSWVLESLGVKAGLMRHIRKSKKGIMLHQTATNSVIEVTWDK